MGFSQTRECTHGPCTGRWIRIHWATASPLGASLSPVCCGLSRKMVGTVKLQKAAPALKSQADKDGTPHTCEVCSCSNRVLHADTHADVRYPHSPWTGWAVGGPGDAGWFPRVPEGHSSQQWGPHLPWAHVPKAECAHHQRMCVRALLPSFLRRI